MADYDWYCDDVLSGKLEVDRVYEDDKVLAFHHPRPITKIHVVAVPKTHVPSLLSEEATDGELLTSMLRAIQKTASDLGLDKEGFSIVANAVAPGVTPHMHWHIMGPGVDAPARSN
jgi:histidine triad (HIT) family protein